MHAFFSTLNTLIKKPKNTFLADYKLFLDLLAANLSEKNIILVTKNIANLENSLENIKFFSDKSLGSIPFENSSLYQSFSIDPLLSIKRIAEYAKIINQDSSKITIVTPQALIKKIFCHEQWQKYTLLLIKNSCINRNEIIDNLIKLGYVKVNSVLDKGSFAVRGSIIDIYNTSHELPIRIDLFGDDIESIKTFDPQTQRSITSLEDITITPAKEIIFNDETIQKASIKLTELADNVEYPTNKLKEKISAIKNNNYFFGIEKLTPAFDDKSSNLFNLINQDYCIVFDDEKEIIKDLENFLNEQELLYKNLLLKNELCFAPKSHYLSIDEVKNYLQKFTTIDVINTNFDNNLIDFHAQGSETDILRDEIVKETIVAKNNDTSIFKPIINKIRSLHEKGYIVIINCSSFEQEQSIKNFLTSINLQKLPKNFSLNDIKYQNHIQAYTFITKHQLKFGAVLDNTKIAFISHNDILGKKTKKISQSGKQSSFKTSLSDLNPDDYIVHVDHGIGQFKGVTKLTMNGVDSDYILVHYQKNEKLYLPIHKINLIKPYQISSSIAVKLDKLGSNVWIGKKQKVQEAVISMAQDLLQLYAKRKLAKRPKCDAVDNHFLEFEADFAFETTTDQQKAIEEVVADMQKDEPMDRLICGDVGYGKTEVAMRASMLAILNNKTVVLLAPTTILAQQHGITFKERFKNTFARIEVLSRFQSAQEIKNIIKDLADNKIDIIIGTHRLLSADINIPQLGLLIVDEEQRFGLKAKEHIKKLKNKIDLLTMSATPIPRTMQMSYLGIKDLSIIETPPIDRLAIQTAICQFDDEIIKEAIEREIARGGQIYFVHNKVQNINAIADYLKTLTPYAKIDIAHGQMHEDELEQKMISFMQHEIDILVCTTIIETGIDVSSANTMFINHADEFGLSQLYQLRGRIGRSKERAFAYLLIESKTEYLSDIAKARLEILHRFSDLGSGFKIAQQDLELRGAGDLLGKNQHGHMSVVGYDLYSELLHEAVKKLQGSLISDNDIDPEVTLPISNFIPEKYCPDLHERMNLYQRLATSATEQNIEDIFDEIEDMYGELPNEVLALKISSLLKLQLKSLHALSLKAEYLSDKKSYLVNITLIGNFIKNPQKFIDEMKNNTNFKITPQNKVIQNIGITSNNQHESILYACQKAINNIKTLLD